MTVTGSTRRAALAAAAFASLSLAPVGAAAEVTWGGYFGANFDESTAEEVNAAFDPYVLALIARADVVEHLRVVGQIDWEHGPFLDVSVGKDGSKALDARSAGEITLSNAYAEYAFLPELRVSAGKFFSPVGFYNQLFYAVPTFATLKLPAESVYKRAGSPDRDALFFQRYAAGLWLLGDHSFGDRGTLGYDLFVSNGRALALHRDDNGNKSVGGRLRFALSLGDATITPTVSWVQDSFAVGGAEAAVQVDQRSVLPGLELEVGELTIKGELAFSQLAPREVDEDRSMLAWYGEAHYMLFDRVTPFVRFERFDPDLDEDEDGESDVTVGAGYHLSPWAAQLKLQVRQHRYDDPAAEQPTFLVFSAGLALGF